MNSNIIKKEYPISIKEDENFPGSGEVFLTKNDIPIRIGFFYESSDDPETVILNLFYKAEYGDNLEYYIVLSDTNAETESRRLILENFPQYKYIIRNWLNDIDF